MRRLPFPRMISRRLILILALSSIPAIGVGPSPGALVLHAQERAGGAVPASAPPATPAPGRGAGTSAAADARNPSGIPYDTARAALRDLLATGEFEGAEQDTWGREIERYLNERITALIERLTGQKLPTDSLGTLLAWTLTIAAVIVMAVCLRRLRRTAGAAPRLIDTRVPRLSSREWVARLRAALAAGDAREAIHCAYHSVLFRFEEQGVWTIDDARTPREYLSLLPHDDTRRPALAALTRDFERAWYGSRAYDAARLFDHLEACGCARPPESAI